MRKFNYSMNTEESFYDCEEHFNSRRELFLFHKSNISTTLMNGHSFYETLENIQQNTTHIFSAVAPIEAFLTPFFCKSVSFRVNYGLGYVSRKALSTLVLLFQINLLQP